MRTLIVILSCLLAGPAAADDIDWVARARKLTPAQVADYEKTVCLTRYHTVKSVNRPCPVCTKSTASMAIACHTCSTKLGMCSICGKKRRWTARRTPFQLSGRMRLYPTKREREIPLVLALAGKSDVHCRVALIALSDMKLPGAGLADLRKIGALDARKTLDLMETTAGDAGLAHLRGLRTLVDLGLHRQPITDAGLAHLADLRSLRSLSLHGTRITDAGLGHLDELQAPHTLVLSRTKISGSGLKHLAGLGRLEILYLTHTRLTDVAPLSRLVQLKELLLSHSGITDEQLRALDGMRGLTRLELGHTAITDDGLTKLDGLTKMRWFFIEHTKVTKVGYQLAKESLPPMCWVKWRE